MIFTTNAFIFHKNKILLIKHKKLGKWLHPGGHVEVQEFFDEALKREIKEETNLDIEVISPFYPKKTNFKSMNLPITIQIKDEEPKRTLLDYVAVAKEPINIKIQESEIDDYMWVSIDELKGLNIDVIFKERIIELFEKFYKDWYKVK